MIFIDAPFAFHYTGFFLVESDNFARRSLWHLESDPQKFAKELVISSPSCPQKGHQGALFSGFRLSRAAARSAE
jgi:hypothetical protein